MIKRPFAPSYYIVQDLTLSPLLIMGEPTIADAICDRLLRHGYKIEPKGESIRKTKK